MKRTTTLTAVVATLLLIAPLATTAQPAAKVHRIGYLSPNPPSPLFDAFRERLRELGYAEGRNLTIEYRYQGASNLALERTRFARRSPPTLAIE